MIEAKGNILSPNLMHQADAICFTSNGVRKKDGSLVMGAGVAKAFRDRFVGLDSLAGKIVKKNGNVCQIIDDIKTVNSDGYYTTKVIAFPTKHHWRNPSDIELIKKSARELMALVEQHGWNLVFLPFPGIGKGGLSKQVVRDAIKDILDDRVVIITL